MTQWRNQANGNQTRQEEDDDADGHVDASVVYTYDAEGNQIMQERDDDGDGNVDYRATSTFILTPVSWLFLLE